ncbi:MAG: hypothetical protein ABI873_05570 [Marmoricola sp.]
MDDSRLKPDGRRATLHCLTGGAIGEVADLLIGAAVGSVNGPTVARRSSRRSG